MLVKADDEIIPNHQIAVLLYSEKFAQEPDAAQAASCAPISARVRFYNGALKKGRIAGPNADEVIAILTASTPIKDPAIYKVITPTGMNPDGNVNVAKPRARTRVLHASRGWSTATSIWIEVVDHSFAEAAVKKLGPYKK